MSSMWIHDIVERHHEVMNPCSVAKVELVGERLRLNSNSTVLDLGAGTAGPAALLASAYGCHVTAVEKHVPFVEAGRRRAELAGVGHLVSYVATDGASFALTPDHYDAALCLGATWILGGFAETTRRLRDAVRRGGHVAVGDVFRPHGRADEIPVPPEHGKVSLTLDGLIETMRRQGLIPVTVVAASEDDWTEYVSRQLLALADRLDEHPSHPDREQLIERSRGWYAVRAEWRSVGWGIVVGRRVD